MLTDAWLRAEGLDEADLPRVKLQGLGGGCDMRAADDTLRDNELVPGPDDTVRVMDALQLKRRLRRQVLHDDGIERAPRLQPHGKVALEDQLSRKAEPDRDLGAV